MELVSVCLVIINNNYWWTDCLPQIQSQTVLKRIVTMANVSRANVIVQQAMAVINVMTVSVCNALYIFCCWNSYPIPVNGCDDNPCGSHSKCIEPSGEDAYDCVCEDGFAGKPCAGTSIMQLLMCKTDWMLKHLVQSCERVYTLDMTTHDCSLSPCSCL